MQNEFNPTDLSKHTRAQNIASLIIGRNEAVSDEDKELKDTHAKILSDKGIDVTNEHAVIESVYETLGGAVAPSDKPVENTESGAGEEAGKADENQENTGNK